MLTATPPMPGEMPFCPWWLGWLRGTPAFRGKRRLARWLLRAQLGRERMLVEDRHGCRYRLPHAAEPVAFSLLAEGAYEPELVDLIDRHLPTGGVFVDVGANIGATLLPVMKRRAGRLRAVAIEASPRVFPFLAENVRLNQVAGVTCLNVAAHERDGEAEFFDAPVTHFGMGSLGAQFGAAPVKVASRRLDGLLAEQGITQVDVLKMDVEGFESAVVRGAGRLLEGEVAPLVVFEFCDWAEARSPGGAGQAQRELLARGFRLWRQADYEAGRAPLPGPLTAGFEALVAVKGRQFPP